MPVDFALSCRHLPPVCLCSHMTITVANQYLHVPSCPTYVPSPQPSVTRRPASAPVTLAGFNDVADAADRFSAHRLLMLDELTHVPDLDLLPPLTCSLPGFNDVAEAAPSVRALGVVPLFTSRHEARVAVYQRAAVTGEWQ
jgi:hypothetical protein